MSAPADLDLTGGIDFSSISDPHARSVLSQMHLCYLHRMRSDDEFKEVVLSKLHSLSSDMSVHGPPVPLGVVYPVMIQAAQDPAADVQSLDGLSSGSSRRTGSSSSGSSVADGPLVCPFCSTRHSNEKSHVQHLSRLLRRWEDLCLTLYVSDVLLQDGSVVFWRVLRSSQSSCSDAS